MRAAHALVPLAAVLLSACATYVASPIDTANMQRERDTRRLDDAATHAVLLRANLFPNDAAWPPSSFTRGQLLAIALANNADVAESRAQLQRAIGGVRTAGALANPSLGLSFEHDTQSGIEPPWLWGLATNFALDGGIRRRQRQALARADVRAGELAITEASWTLRDQLTRGEIELEGARQSCAIAHDTEAAATAWDRAIAARVAAGEASAGDRLVANQALNQARADAGSCQAAEQSARGTLARALGVSNLAVKDLVVDWQRWTAPAMPTPDLMADRAHQARAARPDLAAALVAYDTSELALAQQVHAQYPQVSIGPGYTYDHGIRKLTLGLSATLPVIDQNQGPIAEARAQREAAGKHAEAVQAAVDNDITTAQATTQANLDTWRLAQQATRAAELDNRRAAERVHAGASDRVESLGAALALLAARRAELAAVVLVHQSLAALETALRSPIEGDELILGTPMHEYEL